MWGYTLGFRRTGSALPPRVTGRGWQACEEEGEVCLCVGGVAVCSGFKARGRAQGQVGFRAYAIR